MNKRQRILKAMAETARAETAQGTDLRDVREAVRQTRDDALSAWRHDVIIGGEQESKDQPHEHDEDTMTDIPFPHVTLGTTKHILLDESEVEEFIRGFDDGYESSYYETPHDNCMLSLSHVLMQVQNSWNHAPSPVLYAGFLVGWLALFFEQEQGEFARTQDVSSVSVTARDE